MAESSKKRSNSFRKFFPNIFFKSKDKNHPKDLSPKDALGNARAFQSNQYENQQPTGLRAPKNSATACQVQGNCGDISERIYENLCTRAAGEFSAEILSNGGESKHSSSSTLVSESIDQKYKEWRSNIDTGDSYTIENHYASSSARPQVPPRPQNENVKPKSLHSECINAVDTSSSEYPDIYYHSLEKLSDKITPIDRIQTNKTPKSLATPVSVGAEIKKVSTTFLISPKKEAEVRTIQPKRARSFSLEKESLEVTNKRNNSVPTKEKFTKKAYNYSAPTSPTPTNHKIPSMPATVSPYGSVRKSMNEAEEKKNSLNRPHNGGNLSPPDQTDQSSITRSVTYSSTETMDPQRQHHLSQKEKTRQHVEAFYWQKLKELKVKEDDYLLNHTLNVTEGNPYPRVVCANSICSSPNPYTLEPRSCSLPRGVSLKPYAMNQPTYSSFVRGAPERRTDTALRNQNTLFTDQEIVYRHPDKNITVDYATVNKPRQSPIVRQGCGHNQLSKRVSFEDNASRVLGYTNNFGREGKSCPVKDLKALMQVTPPTPPVRLARAGGKNFVQNKKTVQEKKAVQPGVVCYIYSESESGSEAGEIQRILQSAAPAENDWHGDGSRVDGGQSDGEASRGPTRSRSSRRDDPRRHTLAGNHLYLHPHHSQHNSLDMEPPLPRGYQPQSNAMLFDDDPGIMSEVETASTGFRRGGKQRSSLPVVRTPSKTLERPLGLVFLQYRNETKRALLPNEITSIDTVKALFVRSFPKQLSMQYMDSPLVKIYIHDSSKDMFYELEDVRAHLRDIRDRSVLRLFEATDMGGGVFPGAVGVGSLAMPSAAACGSGPSSWDQDQSYFSEPEIDSEYHHQHVHKSKVKAPAYYMGTTAPNTLPRGGSMLRAYSPAAPPVPADRIKSLPGSAHTTEAYMSSPERVGPRVPYEDPYYTQFLGPAAGRPSITPIIDEEAPDGVVIEDAYQMYGVTPGMGQAPRPMARPTYDARMPPAVDDMQRLRVEKMERQLANLTGLVQKALQVPGAPAAAPRQDFAPTYQTRTSTQDAARYASVERPPKLGKDKFQKSVSFEKSVSFSDDPPDMNSPKQHSPQHSADSKPTKPAIKSSTLPRTSSQERDRLKPAPPPKPAGLSGQQMTMVPQRTYAINVNPDFFSQMRMLQKQARDLRIETRNLRRSTLSHAIQMRQLMAETIVKIGDLAASFCEQNPESQLSREEEIYRQDMLLLENDLYELEATVERLRGQAANRETRVNMADIERIAMVLSKSSKTVADWKLKFPILQDTMKIKLNSEMEKVVRKEKLLEEEPERLELALRRCKKLTGTLVTLKRLACVQEQRLPIVDGRVSPSSSQSSTFCSTAGPSSEEFANDTTCHTPVAHSKGPAGGRGAADQRPENALDALLDELQTFAKPPERAGNGPTAVPRGGGGGGSGSDSSLRRLHSYPSGSDTDASPPVRARGHHPAKPPVPERHPELLALAARRAPPPPPPRTTSRSPLASPPSPASPPAAADAEAASPEDKARAAARQALLEQRHQELLKKQRALQEQYARLQMIQRSGPALPPSAQPDLKKTGSESNLLTKMSLNLAPASLSGSLTQLGGAPRAGDAAAPAPAPVATAVPVEVPAAPQTDKPPDTTTNKVYETDIL